MTAKQIRAKILREIPDFPYKFSVRRQTMIWVKKGIKDDRTGTFKPFEEEIFTILVETSKNSVSIPDLTRLEKYGIVIPLKVEYKNRGVYEHQKSC
jgi:hypothetical protein